MSVKLPKTLTAYFAAVNTYDVDAMLIPFGEGAVGRLEIS